MAGGGNEFGQLGDLFAAWMEWELKWWKWAGGLISALWFNLIRCHPIPVLPSEHNTPLFICPFGAINLMTVYWGNPKAFCRETEFLGVEIKVATHLENVNW